MKIDRLELFTVPPRWLFLKITTDDGMTGWGEPIVEGRAATVKAAVEEMSDYLIGQPAGNIEDIWQTLFRGGFYRGGPVLTSALSGIEMALWDIKGKRFGVPVYELLGGAVRDRMWVYAWIGGDRPEAVAEQARERAQAGYTAIKMNATDELAWVDSHAKIEAAVARVGAIRDALGPEFGIGVDFHGRVHLPMAKQLLRALEPFAPMFAEEPLPPGHEEAFPELSRTTTIPIATGERLYTRWDFKSVLSNGGVAILQPDVSHAGGIWELRKIAAMAEAYDVAFAPHCPLGPISLAASLQVDFCTPNAFIQEQSLGIHYNQGSDLLDYLQDPAVFHFADGYVAKPVAPGLGIEVNEQKVREMAQIGHDWHNPIWRHADGSFAEW